MHKACSSFNSILQKFSERKTKLFFSVSVITFCLSINLCCLKWKKNITVKHHAKLRCTETYTSPDDLLQLDERLIGNIYNDLSIVRQVSKNQTCHFNNSVSKMLLFTTKILKCVSTWSPLDSESESQRSFTLYISWFH